MNILTFDIGGTFIKYALMDEDVNIIKKGKVPTPHSGREEFLETLKSVYDKCPEAEGIAISMPGIIDNENGYVEMGGSLRFNDDFHLRDALYELCPTRIVMENDAKCAAMAEASVGALKDVSDGIVIILGTHIGGGIIHDHKLYRGPHFSAGEFTYVRTAHGVQEHNKEFWGNQCSALELCRLYAAKTGKKEDEVDGTLVFEAYYDGEKAAEEALEEYTANVALQICSLQTVLDPELVAIGGGISAQFVLIEKIREQLDKLYKDCPYPIRKPEVVRCEFGNDANLIGAAQCWLR